MKKLILPVIFLICGSGAGAGVGLLLKSDAEDHSEEHCSAADDLNVLADDAATAQAPAVIDTDEPTEFAKLNNQFIVPVVEEGVVSSMIVVSLSVEVPEGSKEVVYEAEPKLRDGMLQVMFEHANLGGFSGQFTEATNMRVFRQELLKSARRVIGDTALNILILDIVRQDI